MATSLGHASLSSTAAPSSLMSVSTITYAAPISTSLSTITWQASSTTSSIPTQSFTFTLVPFPVTCAAATIVWEYHGQGETFSFFAFPVPQSHTGSESHAGSAPGALVGDNIRATLGQFTWSPVNLYAGRYILHAVSPSFLAASSPFNITNGTDTSCIPPPNAQSTPSPIPLVSHPPASQSVSSSQLAAIGGGVAGGTVVLLFILAVVAYFRFGVFRRPHARPRRHDVWRPETERKPEQTWVVFSQDYNAPSVSTVGAAERPSSVLLIGDTDRARYSFVSTTAELSRPTEARSSTSWCRSDYSHRQDTPSMIVSSPSNSTRESFPQQTSNPFEDRQDTFTRSSEELSTTTMNRKRATSSITDCTCNKRLLEVFGHPSFGSSAAVDAGGRPSIHAVHAP